MDLCRTLIVAALAAILMQAATRISYDADHGLRLAAAPPFDLASAKAPA